MQRAPAFAGELLVNATSESQEQEPTEKDHNYAPRVGAALFEAKQQMSLTCSKRRPGGIRFAPAVLVCLQVRLLGHWWWGHRQA